MSISVSGRRVKGTGKLLGAKQTGWLKVHRIYLGVFEGVQKTEETLYATPRLMRIERQAKALAPYHLTDAGSAAMDEAEAFAAYQNNLYGEGMNCTAMLAEIERGYSVSLREICGTRLVCFQGGWHRDSVAVQVTGDADNPFDCCEMGSEVRLPGVAFELAAQLWLEGQKGMANQPAGEVNHVD